MAAVSREGLTERILTNDRICSRHYISGKPADLLDDANPDWLPSLHLGKNKATVSPATAMGRYERWKAKEQVQQEATLKVASPLHQCPEDEATLEADLPDTSEVVAETVRDAYTQTATASTDASAQNSSDVVVQTKETKCKVKECSPFRVEAVSLAKDEFVRFYTALPNYRVAKALFDHIMPDMPQYTSRNKLEPFQEFMAVLMKLRLNTHMQDLAYRNGVSVSTVSRIFLKWVTVMNARLKPLIHWPDRDVLMKTMPNCFQELFGKSCCYY